MDPVTIRLDGWEITLTFNRTAKPNNIDDDASVAFFATEVATCVPEADIRGRIKTERIFMARCIFSMIMHDRGYSLSAIGNIINHDHGSIRNQIARGRQMLELLDGFASKKFAQRYAKAIDCLNSCEAASSCQQRETPSPLKSGLASSRAGATSSGQQQMRSLP